MLFCPAYTCPLTTRRPRVTAVHDLSFYAWPDDFAALDGIRRRLLVAASVRASRAILACSDFSRREIAQRFPDVAPRVVHVPLAAAAELPPAPSRDEARRWLAARGPVILTAGAVLNRRRLPVLLRAITSLRRAWPDLTLEVVGDNRTHPPLDLEALVTELGGADAVHITGHVSDAGLVARYAAADVFVLLSEYEGFGLPVLEAMARGIPVVTSRRPALNEIFGVGALLVDPGDEAGVAAAIDRVLREEGLRADLVRRGYALAASSPGRRRRRGRGARRRSRGLERGPRRRPARQRGRGLLATRDDRCAASALRPHRCALRRSWWITPAPTERRAFAHAVLTSLIANAANLGFSRANNLGLRAARGEFVLVLNSDCEVRPDAVAALAAILEGRPDVAIVGPRTVGTDGAPQVSFGPSLTPLAEWRQGRLVRGVKAGDAAALGRARALADHEQADRVSASRFPGPPAGLAAGRADESFFYEETSTRAPARRAGGRVLYTPRAEVVHHLGRSMARSPERARLEYHRSHLRFYAKHNSAAERIALRAWMAGRAIWGWLGAGSGTAGRQRRAEESTILRLALFG